MLPGYQGSVDRVVRAFKLKYRLSNAEGDDLESCIIIHLATIAQDPKIAALLDEQKYLRTCINNSARDWLRAFVRYRNRVEPLSEYHQLPNPDTPPVEDHIWLQQATAKLTRDQYLVIAIYYGLEGFTPITEFRSIGKLIRVPRGKVERLYESAMATLRRLSK